MPQIAFFPNLFRHKFPLKPFPEHFLSFIFNLGRCVDASPISSYVLVLTFLCQHLSLAALSFALNLHVDVDVAITFGKNQNASDYDLYIFTCKLFFKINVIQANKNISL